ncbi:unnamed protein product [Arctia plantaginis]|uniref:Microtubule-associated protein futsch n=1 Tax=Arctia plantaginis TaxID=874455 RepID=A0A8S1AYY0_ARCPL|nr:unnamed protein product [Arctia plantaginis]
MGLLSWDSGEHQVDLEKELATLTAQAPEGEEARYGERLIQFASENLVTEILIHPQMNTLMQCMRNLLSSFTRHRHLVHAGYTFAGNGSWIMQDGTFSLADFTDAYQENEVQRVIRAYENSISIDVHCSTSGGGDWAKLPDMPFVKYCKIRVNPTDILDSGSQAIKDFIAYLEPYVVPASLDQLLVPSEVVGNIRFTHPTLYVFPGGQGDAALFGINGFNMLVDGGFSRKACWWDFARHLDRLDAVLFTRLNNCSVSGMASVLRRKASATVYPQIGHFFCNLEERRMLASPDGDKDSDPLLVSLIQEGSDMMADLRHINLKPQHCYRNPEPINLYHKVGHGTLDMYVLNPSKDSKYVREFLKRWHNSEQKLFEGASVSGQFNFPIPNLVSICALLVWRPANPDDTITRIMFPGSTPQHKIFEGLEKLKHLEFLQYPTCTGRQMAAATTTVTAATTTVTSIKTTTKATPKTSKEKSISSEKMKDEKIMEPEPPPKDMKAEDIKNIIDNKLLNELVDGDDKIESVLCDTIAARLETKLDDKIAQYESTVIDGLPKKKEAKKKTVEKKTKRIDKTDEAKDSVIKAELKKIDAETKPKVEKKKVDTRKVEMTSSVTKSKVSHRAIRSVSEKKTTVATLDKKSTTEEKKSPPTTPKKTLDTKTTSTVSGVKDKVKVKARKLSPGSTTAKSTKEAKNRMVVESKYKQLSPKRDTSAKAIEKKETKAKREPISRRPRPLSSPVKGLKTMKSPSKSIKSTKTDTSKLKGLQRVNYEDILKEAKKSDEDTSKSLDDIKQQELDEREEQEIVREIEAVFNRDIEAEEKVEFVGRSDIEKITCLIDDTKTETTADGEFEEEYLIIEKEEVDQYIEDSVVDHVSSHEHADELQKHVKDKEESEKKKDVTVLETEKPEETKAKTEVIIEKELKQVESKEHSVSLEEKQDVSSEKKTSDSKSIQKPKDSLEMQVQESQPDEKISTTIESGATTAPTLPEDERITLDDIKEDQQIEEKHIQEETKELIAPQGLVHTNIVSLEKSPKLESIPAPVREIVKTPDEVADLPLHEVVDYRTFEDKKTPEEEGIQRKIYEVKVPKDLPIPDQDATVPYRIRTVEDDIVLKTVQRASHAELVTVTPGSAPESPMYHEQIKVSVIPDKDLQTVKEYDDTDYNYGQFTEKLRETHITTIDSPIKDDIIVIEEVPCMPEKIPSIPEDVEKEIEEARKLELAEKPPLSPKDVEKIVADVAEVLKSDRSLEEIMAEKSPLLSKSPEVFNKMDTSLSVIEATKLLLSSEQEIQHDSRKEINKTKSLASKIELDITDTLQKEASPVRSITSEDVSEVSDKTVLSEGKRIKRELLDEKPEQKSVIKTVTDEMEAGKMYTESHDSVHEYTESEKKVTTALESARTLEKLEEKIADLKKKPLVIETDIKDIDKKSAAKEISPSKEVLPKKTLLQKAETKAEKVVGKVSALKDEVFGFFSKKSTEKKEPSPEKDLLDRKKDTSGKITDLLGHSEKESSLVKSRDEIIPVKFDQNTHNLIKLDSRSASEQKQQEPNFVFNEDEELFIAEQLKDYEPTGQPEEHSFSQLTTLSENEILIKRKTTITTLIQEYCNTTMTVTIYKVTYLTTEEDEQLDGSKTSRTIRKISLGNERPKPNLDADIKKEVLSLQKPHSTEVLPEKAADEELSSQLHAEVELASKPNEKKKDSPMLRKTTPSPEKAFSLVSSEEDHRSRHMTTRRTPSPVPSKELGPTLSKKVSSPEPTEKAASPATSEKAVSPVLSETLFKKAPSIMPSQKQSILIPREHSPTSEPTAKLDQKTSGPVTREKGFIKTHDKKSPSPVQSDESLYSESGIQSAFDNEQAIDEQLKGFKTYAKPEEQTSTQTVTLTIENVIIIRKIITKIVIEEYFNINNTIVQYKIIKIIIEEDQNPDGTTTSRTHRVVSLSKDKPEISELLRSKSYLEETNGKSPTGLLEDEMKLTRGEDYCDEDGFIIEKGLMDRDHKVVALSETKKSMKDELAITIDKKPLSPEISEAVLNSVPEKEHSQEKKAQTEEVDQEKLFERLEDDISETEIVRGTVDITSDNEIVDIKRILSPLSSKEDSKQLISEKDDDDESIKEHKTIVTKETNELTSNLKIAKDVIDNICKDTMLVTRKIELDENLKEDIVFDKLDEKQVGLEKDILKRKECASEIDGEVKKVSSFIVKATPAIDATIKLPELETLSKLDQPEKPKTKDKMIEALKLENGHLEPSHLSEEMPSEISPTLNKKLISPESRKEILIEKVVTPEPREELSEKAPSASASYITATESPIPSEKSPGEEPLESATTEKEPIKETPDRVPSEKSPGDQPQEPITSKKELIEDTPVEARSEKEPRDKVTSPVPSEKSLVDHALESTATQKAPVKETPVMAPSEKEPSDKAHRHVPDEKSLEDKLLEPVTSKKETVDETVITIPSEKMPSDIKLSPVPSEKSPGDKLSEAIPIKKEPVKETPIMVPYEEPSEKASGPVPSEKLAGDTLLETVTTKKEPVKETPVSIPSKKEPSDKAHSHVPSEKIPEDKQLESIMSKKETVEEAVVTIPSEKMRKDIKASPVPSEKAPGDQPLEPITSKKEPIKETPVEARSDMVLSEKEPSERAPSQVPTEKLPEVKPIELITSKKEPIKETPVKGSSEKEPSDKAPSSGPSEKSLGDQSLEAKSKLISLEKTPLTISSEKVLSDKYPSPTPNEKELLQKISTATPSEKESSDVESSRVPINEVADEKSPSPVLSKKFISDDVADRLITEREIESDDIQEMEKKLEGFKAVGSEKESTITRNITVIENNISIKRKLVITTILQEFRCITKSTTIYKITTVTVEEDSLPDGSIITRTSKKTLLSDKPTVEIISTLPLDKVPNLIEKTLFEPELYPSEKEPSDKAHSPVPSEKLPADEPLASFVTTKTKPVEEIPVTIKSEKLPSDTKPSPVSPSPSEKLLLPIDKIPELIEKAHSNGVPYPITSEKETSDRSPSLVSSEKTLSDGTPSPVSSETLPNGKLSLPRPVQQDKDTSGQVEEIQLTTDENQEIDNLLKEFEAIGNLEETTTSKNFTVTENSVTIKRKLVITTQVQRFYSAIKKITMYKVITISVTEDEHPDGSKVTKRTKNVLLSDKAPETNELSPHVSDEVSFSEVPKEVSCESDKALSPGPSKKVSDTLATCVTSEEEPHDKVSTATLTEKTLSETTHSPVASPKVSDDKSHSSISIEKIPADQKTSYILSEKTLIDQDSTSIVGEQLQVLSLVSSTKPTSPDSTAKLPSQKTTEEVSQDKAYSPTPTDLTPSGKTSVPELSEHGPSGKPSRPFAIDKKLEEIKAIPNGQIPSLSDKLRTEKSGVTKKESETISKDDEKDIDEKELSKQPHAEYMISKSVDVVPTKTLEKSVDESTEVQDIDTDVYEDGESISEDSQIIDLRKDSQVTMTKLDSLQKFPNQTEPVDAHYKVKRSVIEEKPDDDSLTDTLSHKPHGSSSEDVSKEVSLEEKYSFEGTEKSEKKSTQKDYATTQKVDSMSSLDSLTQTLKQYDSKVDKDKTEEPGSPRDEILQSEASDSGVHSIPIEVDSTGQMDTTVTRTIKDNAVNLMESIHKAFGEEIVQQGIKTESLESLVRVSTPPTVPVSPLPKTPSGFQDVKMSDGVQSEVTYDKSDGSEEIITKVVHVGEDVLTQRISTSTEKAPKKPSALIDEDADILTLMQTMGKIKTETDTVTKIIKEGENVVTQTITTVTTKEVISREDGTPQNIKTTIETTTLSKGADGTTTTTTDTQTLLSECSSSLRSTSSMDLYAKDKIEKEYLDIDEKFEMMNLPDKREPSIPIDVDSDFKSFISESEETDDDVEDTIIDTDVSKRIIREKNIDIIETIITVTKKETVRISDCKKLIRTTVETTITKEYPDGSRDVQKNVEVKTEELLLDSGSNLDKILSEYVIFGEPEESVSTKTEELKQDNHLIKRSFVTRIVKVKYADNRGVPRKLKTTTVITTTDDYPDGSSRTKVDSSTSLTDIDKETVESPELEEFTIIENKSIESEKQDKTVLINGKNVLQIITVTTTKETLANIDRSKRKLKTTVETVTETMLPDGMTEVTKDVKISLSDVGIDTLKENLEGFKPIGKPKEDTTMKSATIIEDGVSIKRKTTITTITSEYINVSKSIKRTKTIIKTVLEDEHPDGSVITKTNEKISLSDETLDRTTECEERDRKEKELESQLKELCPLEEPEITESVKREEIKDQTTIIHRTIITRVVKTKYCNSQGIACKLKIVTTTSTTDTYPDGTTKTQVNVSTVVTNIISEDTLTSTHVQKDENKLSQISKKELPETTDSIKSEISPEKEIPLEEELDGLDESAKIDNALRELTVHREPDESESVETIEIVENNTVIKRSITTRIVKTTYVDKAGKPRKLKIVTTVTTTDNFPDGSARTTVEGSTTVTDIEPELSDTIEENLEGFNTTGTPNEDITTHEEIVTDNGVVVKRKTTITTTTQKYTKENVIRTKTTVKTVTEDEHPDGSVITKTSEKVSLVDEYVENLNEDKETTENIKIEAALKDLIPTSEPEVTEVVVTENIKENLITIVRTITTKTAKTRYADNLGVLRKLKVVITVTTIDKYPDGSLRKTVDTNTSIIDVESADLVKGQDLKEYPELEDKIVNVDTQEKLEIRDGKQVKQIITTTTIKETLSSVDGSRKKIRTTVETVTETKLPDGLTEVTKDVKVSVADYGVETFDENLTGFTELGKPEESTTTDTKSIVENGITILRKTTITTVRQEFENASIRSRKIKTTVKTVIEDEHPDGTVIIKKSEKVSIADVILRPSGTSESDTQPPESYIDGSEIVEDTTEDSDVKNEVIQQGSLTIKRTITTKTKRETLASTDKNIKRVRTTVETVTVDEFPDGSTETTKDVKITISEFQKTSDSDLQAALQGLTSTGKVKTSVDKKTSLIYEQGEKVTQTITTYVTKEELSNNETNEIAVKTVTETITENAKDDGSIETTKDVRTQITYLPIGTGLDDWSPEELAEIEKQPVVQEEKQVLDDKPVFAQLHLGSKDDKKSTEKLKKQRSPVGEITTDTETFTKVINEGDNEITQTITIVTTKEVISPEKIKITVETTTVSKGSDGITKTTKSTKTTISEFKEEFEETIDKGESEKSFSKMSTKTSDMRSSSAASDDFDHHGISSPPSDISSRGSRAATRVWGTESSGVYYSDDDGPGSPSSTKSQIAHSPRSNLSFELDSTRSQLDQLEKQDSTLYREQMSTSSYEKKLNDELRSSITHTEHKSEGHTGKTATQITEDFLSKEKMGHLKQTDVTFLKEADEHFEKAIEEHKKVSGPEVISNITAKYKLDKKVHSISSQSSKQESAITLKDLKTEIKKGSESSSTSKQELKQTSDTRTSNDPIESWGKPLGLPSPIMPTTQADSKNTPKKQASATVLNKNKINQEKSKEAKRSSESPNKKKAPAPVYMELTYVPHHGNSYYSAVEFFKRVRARYYVFSGTEPSKEIYNALLDAKKTWEDKDLEVTIIPTYDTDVLGYWVTENEEALEKYKIDLSPSASRCTINLQDHETSCAAYRLEF